MEKNIKNMLLVLCLCVGYTSQMFSSFEEVHTEDRAEEARRAKEFAEKKQQEKEQEWQEANNEFNKAKSIILHHSNLIDRWNDIKRSKEYKDALAKNLNATENEKDEMLYNLQGYKNLAPMFTESANNYTNIKDKIDGLQRRLGVADRALQEAKSVTRKAKFKYYQEVVKAKIPQSIKDFFAKLQDHVASAARSIKLTTSGLSMKLLPNRKKNEGSIEG